MPDDTRLRELATIGARHSHISAGIQWPRGAAGHEFTGGKDCGFASCPHPDCVLVRAAAAGEPPEWQPIETAPKDGTEILAYGPFDTVRWFPADGYDPEGWWGPSHDPHSGCQPTHWMPLPDPPATREEA